MTLGSRKPLASSPSGQEVFEEKGGELVYEHGASIAHLSPDHKAAIQSSTILELHEKGKHEHGEDDDDIHDKDH